jgi:hypothetical protein
VAPRGPKVSNNFGSVPTRRNPARGAEIDGGVAEAEAAGGSPRKKPRGPSPRKKLRGEETFLLRLDWAKAAAGLTEANELEGTPDDQADGGRPKKGLPTTTKVPPVTQEDGGVDDLGSDGEEFDSKDDGSREDGDAARDEATRKAIPACPRGAKRDGVTARDGARRKFIPARPRGAKRDSGADDQTNGDRPKSSSSSSLRSPACDEATCESIPAAARDEVANKNEGSLEDGVAARDEEELDDDDLEDEVGLEDAVSLEDGFAARDGVANKNYRVVATARRSTDDVAVRARAALALAWEPRGH